MCIKRNTSSISRIADTLSLPAPWVTVADPDDGLLPRPVVDDDLKVELVVWSDADEGDRYQLLWNTEAVGVEQIIAPGEEPGDPLELILPKEHLTSDGIYKLSYRCIRFYGGGLETSATIDVEVDRKPPGGTLLSDLKFPPEIESGLTLEELIQLGNRLVAEVPHYEDIKRGDVIQTRWGTQDGPAHTVTPNEVPDSDGNADKIMITFERSFLEALGDVAEPVTYTVTDRAGNISIASIPVTFQLLLKEPATNFPAPTIPGYDGEINDADARATVPVEIPNYGIGIVQAEDQVRLYWGANAFRDYPVAADEVDLPVLFPINAGYNIIALTPDGTVNLKYEVRRNGRLIGTSLLTPVVVYLELPGPVDPDPETPENEALDKPVIMGTSNNPNIEPNVIDEDDYELNAIAIIGWKDEFIISDVINLFWGKQPVPPKRITAGEAANKQDLEIEIPNDIMKLEGTGNEIQVNYTVTHPGNPNTSYSSTQSVEVRSAGDLPGGPDGLAKPIFTNANAQNYLGPGLNANGTPVHVAGYLNAEEFPEVTMTFTGFDRQGAPIPEATYSEYRKFDRNDIANGYDFFVPDQYLRAICVGSAKASYSVDHPRGPVNSAITDVGVDMVIPGSGCIKPPTH